MTFRIAKSTIDALSYDFVAAVEQFRQAKLDHRFTGDAAPRAPDIVENAVRRIQYPIGDEKPDDFVIDFEIVDDTPPPPTLAERKADLVARLRQIEIAAMAAVLSSGRRRLLDANVASAGARREADRSPNDLAALAEHERIVAADLENKRRFAIIEIEIEELTDEAALDAFKLPEA